MKENEAIKAARAEREKSQAALTQAQGKIEALRRMRRDNHVSILLDDLVKTRTGGGRSPA